MNRVGRVEKALTKSVQLEHNEQIARGLVQMWRKIYPRITNQELADRLNREEILTRKLTPYSPHSVRNLMQKPFYDTAICGHYLQEAKRLAKLDPEQPEPQPKTAA